MKDLLKKLAEIEMRGLPPEANVWKYQSGDWNPLTNDAEALALVKKHEIQSMRGLKGQWRCWEYMGSSGASEHEDLNTAICMAVVAAHNQGD